MLPEISFQTLDGASGCGQDRTALDRTGETVQLTQGPLSSHCPGKHISMWREARDQGLVTHNILSQLGSVSSPFTLSGKS